MRKMEQWLGSMNIRKKLIAAYLLFGVLPLVMITIYTYYKLNLFETAGVVVSLEEIKDFGAAIVLADKRSLLRKIHGSAILIFFSCFVISAAAFICMYGYITCFFRKRLEYVREGIGTISSGDLGYRLPAMGTDEIGEIAGWVNELAERLEVVNEASYKKELEIKGVELELLQEQINPHFLYNSLAMLSALAIRHGDESVSDMACSLSDFYRISLNHGKKTLQIRGEIDLLKSYLRVQNARFKDTVRMEFEIDEELLPCETLKLILQPVVENAIHHGRKNDQDILVILLRIFQRNNHVVFEIIDDGNGMRPEEVWKILEDLNNGTGGFGLRNVNARIRQSYGEEYGLTLESEYDFGTKVAIEIPFIKN